MHPKKFISKHVTEICPFSLLLMFVKLVLLITFFSAFFYFFNGLKISVILFKKIFFCLILALFEKFEAKRAKNGSKNQKNVFSKCVLDFNFAAIKGLYSSFSKKWRPKMAL
jgi:hypothetical protein